VFLFSASRDVSAVVAIIGLRAYGRGGDRGSRCEELGPSSLCGTAASLQTGRATRRTGDRARWAAVTVDPVHRRSEHESSKG